MEFRIEDPLAGTEDASTLDVAAWSSLSGPHGHIAEVRGRARRYPTDVSHFTAIDPDAAGDEQAWNELAELAGAGEVVALSGLSIDPPVAWEVVRRGEGVQMVATHLDVAPDPEAVRLGAADVPEMLDLISRTQPGPFLPRTVELGTYLGIRRDGALIAMAGERLHPPGWTEISAVCTDEAWRGQGLASRLVRAVAAGVTERGDRAFLHAAGTNVNAIRLYESLGFVIRRRTRFDRLRVPALP